MISKIPMGIISFEDVQSLIPLDPIRVNPPEYFDQVTTGRNTDLVHAKYSTVKVDGMLFSDSGKSVVYQGNWGQVKDSKATYTYTVTRSGHDVSVLSNWDRYYTYQGTRMRHLRMNYYVFKQQSGTWVASFAKAVEFLWTNNPPEVGPSIELFMLGEPYGASWVQLGVDCTVKSYNVSSGIFYQWSNKINIPTFAPPQAHFEFAEPIVARGGEWRYQELVTRTMQSLTISAWEQLAKLNDNSLQNFVGAVAFIIAVVTGKLANEVNDFGDWLRTLKRYATKVNYSWRDFFLKLLQFSKEKGPSLWLQYRYVYNTGKMDFHQALDFVQRQATLYGDTMRFDANGTLKLDVTTEWHLEFFARLRDNDLFTTLSSRAWIAGVEVNPYVIWDFVPFSFVADWFFDIGDVLKLKSDSKHWLYDFKTHDISWSVHYFVNTEFGTVELYYRFYGSFPVLDGYTYFSNSASVSTTLKRAADSVSLIIGG